MKLWLIPVAAVIALSTGCTMLSLERQTVAQIDSAIDLRYREVMENLAMVADDPSTLPNYSSIFCGTIFVQDQGQIVSTTTWPFSAGMQVTNPSLNRQISQNWTLDPLMVPEKLEAIRAACQWAIGGPDHVYKTSRTLLIGPEDAPRGTERHFGVADQLAQLPPKWLGIGSSKDISEQVCYKAHCGKTWVWVTKDGMKGLADFTLIIQNIARVQINSQSLFNPPPSYTPITFLTADQEANDLKVAVQVVVDQSGHLQTNQPYLPIRGDTSGVDSGIRSAISAAGISSVPH